MAYVCNLDTGQTVYLENQGNLTIITTMMINQGQQQQSSTSIETGNWTSLPEIFRTSQGVMLKIQGVKGQSLITIQGSSISTINQLSHLGNLQPLPLQETTQTPLQPLQPLQPMKPMTMGNMSMSMNPMEMRMGDMNLSMKPPSTKRFCSQCGASVKPEDKFCSSCGHKLVDS
jgi:hypothetical protein